MNPLNINVIELKNNNNNEYCLNYILTKVLLRQNVYRYH